MAGTLSQNNSAAAPEAQSVLCAQWASLEQHGGYLTQRTGFHPQGQPRANGRIPALEAFQGTPMPTASKGMWRRRQSSEDLWLSEPNSRREAETWMGEAGGCTEDFNPIWKRGRRALEQIWPNVDGPGCS